MRVFVSSTSEDLRSYRQAAAAVIRDAQWEAIGMEHFPTDPRPIVSLCRHAVSQSDLVILLQGFRRGWVPGPEKGGDGHTSITALEIAAADEQGTPVLAFLADDGNWPGRLWDHEPAPRAAVQNFRNELNRNAKFFRWEEDPQLPAFRALLSQELANYRLGQGSKVAAAQPARTARLRVPAGDLPLPAHPYPLLQPYEHPRTFGGRDAEIDTLATLVRLPPLILCLHASSGVGKSSLLVAGVTPRLRAQGYAVSLERAPGDPGLAQRLIRDLFEADEPILLHDDDEHLATSFAEWIAHAHSLSAKPAVLVIDQFDDVLRNPQSRDEVLARIGPLIGATAQRLPGIQGFACKWVLCYRDEFHGEVRGWLDDVLVQARARGRAGIASLPHEMSGPQKAHDWVLPVFGKPAATDRGDQRSREAFLEAIVKPLSIETDGKPRYPFVFLGDGADRLANSLSRARKAQPDAPLVPELQVVLNHLLHQPMQAVSSSHSNTPTMIEVPSDEDLEVEIRHALANHLERVLTGALSEARAPAAGRLARTRALLALRYLADHEGRRSDGLPEDELVRMLGRDGRRVLDHLSSADARLIVVVDGRCVLSHDRLAEVVSDMVSNEAARGDLLLDQGLIDLQRVVSQKLALHVIDPSDNSALALSRQYRGLLELNHDTILFDDARRSWWQASQNDRQTRARRLRLRAAFGAVAVAVAILGTLLFVYPPAEVVTLEAHRLPGAEWHVGTRFAVSATANDRVVVWDLRNDWDRHVSHDVKCPRLTVSTSATHVACITAAGDVHVWRADQPMTIAEKPLLSGLRSHELVDFSRDGRWLIARLASGEIQVWQTDGSGPVRALTRVVLEEPSPGVFRFPHVQFSPDNSWLAIVDGNFDLFFTKPTDYDRPLKAVGTTPDEFYADQDGGVAFSDDGRRAAWTQIFGEERLSSRDEFISVIDLDSAHLFSLRVPKGDGRRNPLFRILAMGLSADGRWLVGRQPNQPFITWDLTKGASSTAVVSAGKRSDLTRDDVIRSVTFSRDGEWVAGVANDVRLHLWRPMSPPGLSAKPVFPREYVTGESASLDFSPDSTRAAAVAPDGWLHVWTLGSESGVGQPVTRHYLGAKVRFSDDSRWIYSADLRSVHSGRAGEVIDPVANPESAVQVVSVTPDQRRLVIFTREQVILAKRGIDLWGTLLQPMSWPALTNPLVLGDERLPANFYKAAAP